LFGTIKYVECKFRKGRPYIALPKRENHGIWNAKLRDSLDWLST